jgi:chromosome segregation ATPase
MCNEITNLKKIIDVQNGKIDRLNNENSSQNNEIANLKDENVHLNNEIANLKDENVHLNNEIANLNDEIANLKELVNTQNSTIDSQENIIQMLREENSALYEMENQQREWIMALRDSYNQLDVDYNDLCNSVEGINNSLQEVIYNLQNYNPFNINFFE